MEKISHICHMKKREIRVTGVPDKISDQLKAIAHNSGITLSQLLRPKLREIADEYPENMKQKSDD